MSWSSGAQFTFCPTTHLGRVRGLFEPLDFCVEVPSILTGTTRGHVYVDAIGDPTTALIWDGLVGLFLAGDHTNPSFNRGLAAWFAEQPLAVAQREGISELAFAFAPNAWGSVLPRIVGDAEPELRQRLHFIHPGPAPATPGLEHPYTVVRLTRDLMARENVRERGFVTGWLTPYWHSLDGFFDRGLGYVVLHRATTVVSHCVSVFADGDRLEFGTATHHDHRSRGLSTAATAACAAEALGRGLRPVWHCWQANVASAAVARRVGFRLERAYWIHRVAVPPLAAGTS